MRNLLIVSPHFPPVDLPDMHRVRVSLPYFHEFGWQTTVLSVAPDFVEASREPLFLDRLPAELDLQPWPAGGAGDRHHAFGCALGQDVGFLVEHDRRERDLAVRGDRPAGRCARVGADHRSDVRESGDEREHRAHTRAHRRV